MSTIAMTRELQNDSLGWKKIRLTSLMQYMGEWLRIVANKSIPDLTQSRMFDSLAQTLKEVSYAFTHLGFSYLLPINELLKETQFGEELEMLAQKASNLSQIDRETFEHMLRLYNRIREFLDCSAVDYQFPT